MASKLCRCTQQSSQRLHPHTDVSLRCKAYVSACSLLPTDVLSSVCVLLGFEHISEHELVAPARRMLKFWWSACSKGAPAYAIVMSGGYRDDIDEGIEIDYTGEGGQKGGKHVGTAHPSCLWLS